MTRLSEVVLIIQDDRAQSILWTYIMFPGNWACVRVSADITGEVNIIPFLNQKCYWTLKFFYGYTLIWSSARFWPSLSHSCGGSEMEKTISLFDGNIYFPSELVETFCKFVPWLCFKKIPFSFSPMQLFYPDLEKLYTS